MPSLGSSENRSSERERLARELELQTLRAREGEQLSAIRSGDVLAFNQLYQRYAAGLLGFILQRVPNRAEAEEILQETFVRVLRDKKFEPGKAGLGTYLYVIARNLTLNHLRDHAPARHQALETTPESLWETPSDELADHKLGQHQQLKALRAALETIPAAQREAFVLRHQHGRSYQEIAEIVQCPVGTAKSRVHLAVAALKEALEPALDNVRPMVSTRSRT